MRSGKTIFNLALLFEPHFSEKLIVYSKALEKIQSGRYILGINSVPHVTILQFEECEDKITEIWDLVKGLKTCPSNVDFCGLGIIKSGGYDWLSLRAVRRHSLEQFQKDLLDLLSDLRLKFFNKMGEEFDPHVTLAAWPPSGTIPSLLLQDDLLSAQNIQATLALGRSGPSFQFEEQLFPK